MLVGELAYYMLSFLDPLSNGFDFITITDHFSECVESHAYSTYDKFVKARGGIIENFFLIASCVSLVIPSHAFTLCGHKERRGPIMLMNPWIPSNNY